MIIGEANSITEKEYRKLDFLNQSALKDYADNRKKFFKKYILKEKIRDDEEENQAIIMGNLVDCLLLTPEDFDKKFVMSTCEDKPTGNNLKFCEALYSLSISSMDEEGKVTETFGELSLKAYNKAGIKKPGYDKFIVDFAGSNAEAYYKEILLSRPNALTVITVKDVENAEGICSRLKTSPFTSEIINTDEESTDGMISVYNQFPITGFDIQDVPFKILLDKLHINHEGKEIQPYDLKCTWNPEEFYKDYYLYRKSYLQAAVYDIGVRHWASVNYPDYKVLPMQFIVCDSINYCSPLIYKLGTHNLIEGMNGFLHNNKYYQGVNALIEGIKWSTSTGNWDVSMQDYANKGIREL